MHIQLPSRDAARAAAIHDGGFHCPPSDSNCTPLPSSGEMFLDSVISFEAIAALIWLRRGKRVAPPGEHIGLRDQK